MLDPTLIQTLDALTLSEERYLRGPIVQPRLNGWDFPDRLRALVPAARCVQITRGRIDEHERDLASEEEALGYLACISLDAPLDHDWAEIFFHLGQQVFPRWGLTGGEDVHTTIGLARPVTLHSQQIADLTRFRRWLRQKISGHVKTTKRRTEQRVSVESSLE